MKPSLAAVLSDRDGWFVAGLIGVLVFLAVIAMSAVLLVGSIAERWQDELASRILIQLSTASDDAPGAAGADGVSPETALQVQQALELLRAQPEVARAERLSQDRLAVLLQEWVGSQQALQSMPLPAVIEVELRPDARKRATELRERLRTALLHARIDAQIDVRIDGGPATQAPALRLMQGIEVLAILVVVVLAATLATSVVFATRTGLSRHQDAVEILHLLGADEAGIVDALTFGALRTALIGGIAGLVIGWLTLLAFGRLAAGAPYKMTSHCP
ncbi:MAG: hypothetical protein HWD60_16560 [Defluviicoccus sp.]|nr:MAG: hypothetical protein HWD60_16560 [Defluviicoccus sp.]